MREQIGSRAVVAELLGVDPSTLYRREKGDVGLYPEAEMALRELLRRKRKRAKRRRRQ